MPLVQPVPPAAAQAEFASGLPSFLAGSAGLGTPTSVGSVIPTIPTAAEIGTGFAGALEVFTLSLRDAAGGSFSPSSIGWQLYAGKLDSSSSPIILGTVAPQKRAKAWKLTYIDYGPSLRHEALALGSLRFEKLFEDASYEPRMLVIPGVNVQAFWIAAQQAGAVDYVVPLPAEAPSLIPGLSGSAPFELRAFMKAIAPLAAANLDAAPYTGG